MIIETTVYLNDNDISDSKYYSENIKNQCKFQFVYIYNFMIQNSFILKTMNKTLKLASNMSAIFSVIQHNKLKL